MNNRTTDHKETMERHLRQVQRELRILYSVSNALRTTLELNHILYIILTGVTSHSGLGFNRAVLFLPSKDKRQLECKMVIGPESGERAQEIWQYFERENPEMEELISTEKVNRITHQAPLYHALKDLRIPLEKEKAGLLAEAYHNKEPLHLQAQQLKAYADDSFLKVFQSPEFIVMPLRTKNEVKGLIVADNLYTSRPITEDDVRAFRMLADQAALAIENSLLYEMVVHKSHTDSLTGLWNHGFFQQTLAAEIDKARELGQPVSLAMIDIDDFKKLNDRLGHQNGDVILKELARTLKNLSREIDYVCRYGGEEFAAILTQANRDNGYTIAERMRENISRQEFPQLSDDGPSRLTVSIGVASFPEDASRSEELIAKADRAMYIAKFSGKNRTCLADGHT